MLLDFSEVLDFTWLDTMISILYDLLESIDLTLLKCTRSQQKAIGNSEGYLDIHSRLDRHVDQTRHIAIGKHSIL